MLDDILMHIAEIRGRHNSPIMIIGDMNAGRRAPSLTSFRMTRTRLQTNCKNIPARTYSDKVVNNNVRALVRLCRTTGPLIVTGRYGTEADIGAKTGITSNGSSTTNYAHVTTDFVHVIRDFQILDFFHQCMSDVYCPMVIFMASTNTPAVPVEQHGPDTHHQATVARKLPLCLKWDNSQAGGYTRAFSLADMYTYNSNN